MATISYVVNAVDSASATFARIAGSADELLATLDDLSHKTATARVGLDGDKEATALVDKLELKMAKLAQRVDKGTIGVEGQARAITEIHRLELAMDKFSAKHSTATVDVKVDRSALSRLRGLLGSSSGGQDGGGSGLLGLLGGAGGAASGGAQAGGGAFSALPAQAKGAAIGAGILGAAALGPSVIGLGLGGLAGAGAIGGGLFGASEGKKILKADTTTINQITTGLKTAIGNQKKLLSADLVAANKQYAKDSNFYAPFLGFQKSLQDLARVVLKPLQPVMAPLTALFTEFGKGLAKLGPVLTQVLDASIPFVHTFLNVLLKAGAQLLPAFSYALNQMVSSGALDLMTQGLVILTGGLAKFIVALGPGMQASALIFRDMAVVIAAVMQGIGKAVSWVANVLEDYFHRAKVNIVKLAAQFDDFRHRTAVVFDGVRHDIAHVWDQIFQNSIGMVIRLAHNVETQFNSWRHGIAGTFDAIRHDIAAAWDTIWRNTVTRVQRGISDVIGWFKGLPGRAIGALFGLGHQLYAFGHAALTEFLGGFKSIGGTVLSWIGNFAKNIWSKVKSFFKINSPSSLFYDIGKNLMLGLFHGIKDHAWKAAHAAQQAAAGLQPFSGKFGAGVTQWAPDILKALAMLGQSSANLGAVEHRMMQESGGNPNAINLTDINARMGDPSRGLMQTIGSTFEHYRSWLFPNDIYNPMANIFAGLNYAIHAYPGRSLASVMMQPGGYFAGTSSAAPGWAWVGERGPELMRFGGGEQVIPNAAVGGNTYNVTVNVPPSANQAEIGRHLVTAIGAFEKRSGKGWRK